MRNALPAAVYGPHRAANGPDTAPGHPAQTGVDMTSRIAPPGPSRTTYPVGELLVASQNPIVTQSYIKDTLREDLHRLEDVGELSAMDAPNTPCAPFTMWMPQGMGGPIEVRSDYSVIHMAVVERACATNLPSQWGVPGAYVLLDRPDALGRWGAYVGMAAPGTLSNRLRDHLRARDHWYRAVLIRRNTDEPFHTSQAGWLEGHLYDLLASKPHVRLHNGKRPQDLTLSAKDQAGMQTCVPPIVNLLHALSHHLDPGLATLPLLPDVSQAHVPREAQHQQIAVPSEPSKPLEEPRRSGRYRSEITVLDLIQAGLLTPGAKLVSKSPKHPGTATVAADGRIHYAGKEGGYPTLSAPAHKLTGSPQNGWDFWKIETPGGWVKIGHLRRELEQRRATGSEHATRRHPPPNEQGIQSA